jgi:putative DNA primase/helicase
VQRAKRQQQTMSLRYDPTRAKNDRKRRIEKARQIIENSSSIHDGDFVDRYLRGRKLRPHGSLWPSSLRKAQLWHPQTRKTHPAMVGIVTDVQNMAIAVHRTYLTEDGRKAEVEPVKMSLGPVGGGAIRLGVDSDTIIVAEGIESALGAAMVYNVVPWATLSAGNMEVLQIPKSVKQVIIAPDNDRSSNPRKNEVGYKAALKLRNRIKAVQKEQDRIIHVRVVYPPRGRTDFADFG